MDGELLSLFVHMCVGKIWWRLEEAFRRFYFRELFGAKSCVLIRLVHHRYISLSCYSLDWITWLKVTVCHIILVSHMRGSVSRGLMVCLDERFLGRCSVVPCLHVDEYQHRWSSWTSTIPVKIHGLIILRCWCRMIWKFCSLLSYERKVVRLLFCRGLNSVTWNLFVASFYIYLWKTCPQRYIARACYMFSFHY